jgi:hypothetical protein
VLGRPLYIPKVFDGRNHTFFSQEIDMEERLTHDLTVLAGYTISKPLRNCITSVMNRRNCRAVLSMDHSRIANLGRVYNLPLGKVRLIGGNLHSVGGSVLGNWSVSGCLYFASGVPLFSPARRTSAYWKLDWRTRERSA